MARRLGLSETVVGHARGELKHRDWLRNEDHPDLYDNNTLERELARLCERMAAIVSEHV
jgi:hypothetical protein